MKPKDLLAPFMLVIFLVKDILVAPVFAIEELFDRWGYPWADFRLAYWLDEELGRVWQWWRK